MSLEMMTQSQLAAALAEKVPGASQADAKRFLLALQDTVNDNLGNCVRTKVAGVMIEPKLRAATKARVGRNPQTGEEVQVSAKPASVRVATRATKALKEFAPSIQRLKKNLA